jgi:hypothetical protein
MSAVDRVIAGAAGSTVVVLAGVAGAISCSHMAELARLHGEVGWRSHAFPVSVDGIEIVASLVLLAHRRAGTRAGWLPWAALAAGTVASVAANVAVGASDPVGRLVAGWPAVALLVAIKLLSGLLDAGPAGVDGGSDQATGDGPASGGDGPADGLGPGPRPDRSCSGPADPRLDHAALGSVRHGPVAGSGGIDPGGDGPARRGTEGTGPFPSPVGMGMVPVELEEAARVVRDRLISSGTPVNRRNLAAGLRAAGYRVRNDRLGHLMHAAATGSSPGPPPDRVDNIRDEDTSSRGGGVRHG